MTAIFSLHLNKYYSGLSNEKGRDGQDIWHARGVTEVQSGMLQQTILQRTNAAVIAQSV
jgi:hypothetical protein